jgi:hypothetical protein
MYPAVREKKVSRVQENQATNNCNQTPMLSQKTADKKADKKSKSMQ